ASSPPLPARPRPDPNNNNEWRPLGHGDPLQKDPTYDYSPPALERVRYWAENNSTGQSNPEARKKELPPEVLRNKTKSEILVLGQASERVRVPHSHSPTHLQSHHPSHPHPHSHPHTYPSKYAPIRRSYYAPTHHQSHMPHTHLMPPPPMMMVKSSGPPVMPHMEYRHNMMATGAPTSYMSYMSSPAPKQAMTSSVIYHQPSSSMAYHSASSPHPTAWHQTSMPPHRLSYPDPHRQETMQTFSFSRPNAPQSVSYSPNSLPGHQAGQGGSKGVRKPWLHELLQKEVVMANNKPKVKPTMPATKYLMGTSKPHHSLPPAGAFGHIVSTHAPMYTYKPVTFVPGPPTIAVPTVATHQQQQQQQSEIYITPTPQTSSSGFRPMLVTSPTTMGTTTTATPQPPVYSTTSNRLLIPQTSNLAHRPTVAPAPSPSEATTDSLFSHYRQPSKPLLGPMYLIIEGHSKVKTYGQNELDPHSPKIVPVISKREPVVRTADPSEKKRGTVETFQVKHLHTKTTPYTEKPPTTTTRGTPSTTKASITAPTTTPSPASSTTRNPPKLSVSTTVKTTEAPSSKLPVSSATPLALPLPEEGPASGVKDLLSLLDNMFADAQEIVSSTRPPPPAATASTVLKPVVSTRLVAQQPEPRISNQAAGIESLLDEDGSTLSTETPPRATRQVFDYDQLPESRIKEEGVTDASDMMEYNDEADEEEENQEEEAALGENDDNGNHEEEEDEHNLLERIDRFVDDVDDIDDGEDDLEDLIEGLGDEDNEEDRGKR
ncbi:hypothetical protein KR018_002089, partial [Drosophila ironensis]